MTFPVGGVVLYIDEQGKPEAKARPSAACVTIEDGEVHYHPPAEPPDLRALARLCEQYGVPYNAPDAPVRLALELARRHCPDAFKPAGRNLTADERRMSIAWLIDQEQQDGETVPSALARVWERLVENELIEPGASRSTVHRLAKQGARSLAQRGMIRWRSRRAGRPKKDTQQPS